MRGRRGGNGLGRIVVMIMGMVLVSCGGGAAVEGAAAVLSDGTDAADSNSSGTAAADGLPQPAEITMNLSGARAFLIQDENSPVNADPEGEEEESSETTEATEDTEESATPIEENGGDSAVETNFWILDEEGHLKPAVEVTNGNGRKVEIERIDTAPTGETYFLFAHTVSVRGTRCKWVVVSDDAAACADPDTRFEFDQIKFGGDGTAYYSDTTGQIRERENASGAIKTLFSGEDIGFDLEAFLPAPDGSLLLAGDLTGTSRRFFRLLPDEEGDVVLETPCLRGVKTKTKGSAPGNEMFLSRAGELYVKSTLEACVGLPDANLYKGVFAGGNLEFEPIAGVDADFFAEDSSGAVYAVLDGRGGDAATLTRVDGELPGEPEFMPLERVESLKIVGDFVYATGSNASGEGLFLRKNLLPDGGVDDLLGNNELIVQDFQADATGDVYFGAVDYSDAGGRKLFRFDAVSGALEPLAVLPQDLKEIVFIGDQDDPYGLGAL